MTTLEVVPGGVTIRLTVDELYALHNALNEVCNGLDIQEFSSRMGVEREEAATLQEQIHALLEILEPGGPA
jgi:hypothetical protein